MKRLTYLILLLSNLSLACEPVSLLRKGEVAACEGFLFTREKEAEVRQKLLDGETYKFLDDSNKRIIEFHIQEKQILTDQAALWRTQSESLSKQLVAADDRSFWRNTLFFALGALITTGIVYGVNRASK